MTLREVRTLADDSVALYADGELLYAGPYIPASIYRNLLPITSGTLACDEAFAQMGERWPGRLEDMVWGDENIQPPSLEEALYARR